MYLFPTTKLVFDRKKLATKKNVSKSRVGLVQLEISYQRKRKYYSTGVHVYADEWENGFCPIKNRHDCDYLNRLLASQVENVNDCIAKLRKTDGFTWEALESMMRGDYGNETFIEYILRRVEERPDLCHNTKKNHRKLAHSLMDFGEINSFGSLTRANIIKYNEWLMAKGLRQTTVCSYIKFLRVYIHDAMNFDLLDKDPSRGLRVSHGRSVDDRWLTEEEVERIRQVPLLSNLEKVRDVFLFQCYSGLAYCDLVDFAAEKMSELYGVMMLIGRRRKTGEIFSCPVLPELREILDKYNMELPIMSNQQYNMRLKLIAEAANINKPIASHWGRRTCGYMMARKGYSIEVIARVLGHSNIMTTQQVYAKYLPESVAREFKKIEKSPAV